MASANTDLKNALSGMIETKVWMLLNEVADYLTGQDIEAYLVGGWVRDVLLGRNTADIDITIAPDALKLARSVAETLGGKYVLLDKENRVGRVIFPDAGASTSGICREIDFSTLKGNIEQDLARRDFTIDAMAISLSQLDEDLSDVRLIDPHNGYDDLRQGIIRNVADDIFVSDAARLLRAVRLAAELGFTVDEKTEDNIRRHSHLITGVAGERVREELLRLLAVSDSGLVLTYLDELGILTVIFPEMERTKGIEQPKEHFRDVFKHSLLTVTAVDFLFGESSWEYASEEVRAAVPWSEELAEHFGEEVRHASCPAHP